MQANKDPKIQIKETDKYSYHVLLTRRTGTVHNPVTYRDVQIYSGKDFALLNKSVDDQGINITGYHEMRIVHDPVLQKEIEAREEKARANAEKAREAKAAKAEGAAKKVLTNK